MQAKRQDIGVKVIEFGDDFILRKC
ncbi:MAG: hypothetical protein ACJA0S_000339 [Rickettsiales bacterium]